MKHSPLRISQVCLCFLREPGAVQQSLFVHSGQARMGWSLAPGNVRISLGAAFRRSRFVPQADEFVGQHAWSGLSTRLGKPLQRVQPGSFGKDGFIMEHQAARFDSVAGSTTEHGLILASSHRSGHSPPPDAGGIRRCSLSVQVQQGPCQIGRF